MKRLLFVWVLCLCLGDGMAIAQKSEPILVGYGRDPKWSPSETAISLIRNDSLFVTRLDSTKETKFVRFGPIFKYEWLDDSTLVTQERRFFDAKDGKRVVEKILRVSLGGKVVEAAIDSSLLSGKEGQRLGLMKFSDGTVGYSKTVQGDDGIVKLPGKAVTEASLSAMRTSLFVETEPISWGKVWLYYGSKENGRQITKSANTYSLPRLAPTGDKFLCKNHRGEIVIYDTLDNELANLGRGDMESWDPSGQYILFCKTQYSEFDIEKSDVFLSKYDGTEIVQITATPGIIEFEPTFSPSWRYIMYSNDRTGAIYVQRMSRSDQ
jgi:hypothetical protein